MMTAEVAQSLLAQYGYRIKLDETLGMQYRTPKHPRGWVWLLWVGVVVMGVVMLILAIAQGQNQDMILAGAAMLVGVLLAWNNYRLYTRPFQTVIAIGEEGISFYDRNQSLNYPPDAIAGFQVLGDDKSAVLLVSLENQNVKPALFRFVGKDQATLQQDMEAIKTFVEELLKPKP